MAAGVTILLIFARVMGLEIEDVKALLAKVNAVAALAFVPLLCLQIYLSAIKWRMINARIPSFPGLTPGKAFMLTAIGNAIAQILPVQLSSAIVRTLGSRAYGFRFSAGIAAVTLYEQMFDLAVVITLSIPSVFVLVTGRIELWFMIGLPAVVILYFGSAATSLVPKLIKCKGNQGPFGLSIAIDAGLFDPAFSKKLTLISIARFWILPVMAAITSWSSSVSVPLSASTVALPLVAVATAVPLTPAGLGVNEFTFTSVLTALGCNTQMSAAWSVVNRVFVGGFSIAIGLVAVLVALAAWSLKCERGQH